MEIAQSKLYTAFSVAMLGILENQANEGLTHVFFTGKRIYGFDGLLYAEYKLASEFKGSVRAASLWTLVSTLSADAKKNSSMVVENSDLVTKINGARIKCPFDAKVEFHSEVTSGDVYSATIADLGDLKTGLRSCLAVVSAIAQQEFSRGVVFGSRMKALCLYGTDANQIVRYQLKDIAPPTKPFIVPDRMVRAMIVLADLAVAAKLPLSIEVGQDKIACVLKSESAGVVARVVSATLSTEELPNFDEVIKVHTDGASQIELPSAAKDRLVEVLSRAKKLMNAELAKWVHLVGSQDGKLHVVTETKRGEAMRESVGIAVPPDLDIYANADGFGRALENGGTSLMLSRGAGAVRIGKGSVHLFPVSETSPG